MSVHPHVAHRGGLSRPLRPDTSLFARIGGESTVARLVDGLYDRIERDKSLRPMFVRNLDGERDKQKAFFAEWLGDAPEYTERHAYSGLRHRHSHIHITQASADRWLGHFEEALRDALSDGAFVDEILPVVRQIARQFVNEADPPERDIELRCRRERPYRALQSAAGKNDVAALRRELDDLPKLLDDPIEMAVILYEAALRGRTDAVEALLECGVDPNIPAHHKEGCIYQSLLVTPLCAALYKKRTEVAQRLREAGAVYDIFTAAYLGDLDAVTKIIDRDPGLVDVQDPATDVLHWTPLHHAVFGGHRDLVVLLFRRGARVGPNSAPMVRHAANHGQHEVVRLLVRHDASVSRIGPGPWVLDEELAGFLQSRGADVNDPHGEWIWRALTGNNSQRDDPEYVAALVDRGADLAMELRGARPLHYASKAGFAGAVRVLLERGADPNAVRSDGETALHYALKAGKRADIPGIVRLLVEGGADPDRAAQDGTPREVASRRRKADRDAILEAMG